MDKPHLEWFFAKVNDVCVRSEVLGRPETLVAVGLFADKGSVRLGQVGAYMSLQMGFAKIRLIAHGADERALIAKFISAMTWKCVRSIGPTSPV